MKERPVFRLVPAWNSAFKVQKDSYERVVYQGDMGISGRLDKDNELIGRLLCYCDPRLDIQPISEAQYQSYVDQVNLHQRQQANC